MLCRCRHHLLSLRAICWFVRAPVLDKVANHVDHHRRKEELAINIQYYVVTGT